MTSIFLSSKFKLGQFEWVQVGSVVDVFDEAVDDSGHGVYVTRGLLE